MQINQSLVNAHFKLIIRVGTFSRRRLAGGNLEMLRGKADGSGHVQLLFQGALFQIGTDLFNVFDIARGEGDANAMNLLLFGATGRGGREIFLGGEGRHDIQVKSLPTGMDGEKKLQVRHCDAASEDDYVITTMDSLS